MSNEYKDWIIDKAQEYVIENYLLKTIENWTYFDDGLLINGYDEYGAHKVYFIELNSFGIWHHIIIK